MADTQKGNKDSDRYKRKFLKISEHCEASVIYVCRSGVFSGHGNGLVMRRRDQNLVYGHVQKKIRYKKKIKYFTETSTEQEP